MIPIGERWLVVSDVDGTLLGEHRSWERLTGLFAGRSDLLLVPNSSRPLASLARSWRQFDLLFDFPAQVGGLGTEVEVGGEPSPDWSDRFPGFDRWPFDEVMSERGYPTNGAEFQTAFKASYLVPKEDWDRARRLVTATGEAKVICSGQADFDVIPPGAGKAAPLGFLCHTLGVDPDHTVAAGDSLNDLEMLVEATHRIVVGNAEPELVEALAGRTYAAQGVGAGGVIEGLKAWGVL